VRGRRGQRQRRRFVECVRRSDTSAGHSHDRSDNHRADNDTADDHWADNHWADNDNHRAAIDRHRSGIDDHGSVNDNHSTCADIDGRRRIPRAYRLRRCFALAHGSRAGWRRVGSCHGRPPSPFIQMSAAPVSAMNDTAVNS